MFVVVVVVVVVVVNFGSPYLYKSKIRFLDI